MPVHVHQAAKLVAVLLRVVGVTTDLAESNGSLYRRVCDSRYLQVDLPRNPTLGNRVWAIPLPFLIMYDTYLGLYHYTRKDCFKFFSVITINIQLKIVL